MFFSLSHVLGFVCTHQETGGTEPWLGLAPSKDFNNQANKAVGKGKISQTLTGLTGRKAEDLHGQKGLN